MSYFPTPDCFDITPPFPDMDGKQIRLKSASNESIAIITVRHDRPNNRFGLRADATMHFETNSPYTGRFVIMGYCFSRDQILRIKATGDDKVPFEVTLP